MVSMTNLLSGPRRSQLARKEDLARQSKEEYSEVGITRNINFG
jgi:hypothetical protein